MWRIISRNLPIKLTSLGLALLLWLVVAGQREVVRQLQVPLDLPAMPDSLMYLKAPPETVTVTFSASARLLLWFRLQPPRLLPSLPMEAHKEPVTINLRREFLSLPRQFTGEVLSIHPPTVEVQLVEMVEVEVPIFVVIGREPRHPYRLVNPDPPADPPTVMARGPKAQVQHRNYVRTRPLNLADKTTDGEVKVELEASGPLITYEPREVKVRYKILEWQAE